MATKIGHQTSPDRLYAWMLSDPEKLHLVGEISHEPSLSEAMTVVDDFDLPPLDAADAVLEIIAVVNDWQSHFRSVGVTYADITEVAALIDAPDLLTQRQSFSAEAYAQAGKPQRKRSPSAKAFR